MNLTVFKYLTWRQLRSKWLQALLATLGIAGGIALHFSVRLINQTILDYFQQNVAAVAGQASLFVAGGPAGFPEKSVSEAVAKVPGVKFVVPVIETRAFLHGQDGTSESILMLGVDLLKEKNVRSYRTDDEDVIDDPLEFFNQPDSLILPKSLASRLHLKVDSKIRLATTRGAKEFTVRGLLSESSFSRAFGGAIGIMDISAAQYTFGKNDKLDRLDVVVDSGYTAEKVAASIGQALGAGFTVERPQNRSERTERMVQSYQFMLSFFSSLALIVGLVLVYAMVSRFVSERRREIGTYRALGATRSMILVGCLSQGLVQGVLGGLLGAELALLFANHLLGAIAQSMAGQFDMVVAVDRIRPDAHLFWQAVLEGVGVAALAAWIPAWHASRVSPLEAIRSRGADPFANREGQRRLRLTLGLGLVLLVMAAAELRFAPGGDWRWSLMGQALFVSGSVLGVASLNFFATALSARLCGWGPLRLLRLGFENVRRSPGVAMQNSAVLTVGLLILCVVQVAAGSFRYSLHRWLDRPSYWELGVASAGDLNSTLQPLQPGIGDEILQIPGVVRPESGHLTGMRQLKAQVDGRDVLIEAYDDPGSDEARALLLQSEDPEIGQRVADLYRMDELRLLASDSFLRQSHKGVGDLVRLPVPGAVVEGRIIGEVNDFTSAGGTLYMARAQLKRLWHDDLITAFGVKVKPGADVNEVRRAIDGRLARARDLMVMNSASLKQDFGAQVDRSLAFMDALKLAVMALVWISLANTFLTAVLERQKEIGLLRAVGTSRAQLVSILLGEYAGQGLQCAILTLLLGLPPVYVLVRYTLSGLLGWTLHFYFPVAGAIEIALTGAAVCALAGVLPMFHATRMQITEALRYE